MLSYKIIVGDNDEGFLNEIRLRLSQLGHRVLDVDTSGSSLIRKIRGLSPDVVIAEASLRGMTGFELSEILEGEGVCPCIISFKGEPYEYRINLSSKRVKTYLKKPVDYNEIDYILKHSIDEFERIKSEERKIKEKKIVDRAKRLLMEKYSLNEDEAYKYIRKKSMDKKTSMVKIARVIMEMVK